jgi:hypothetical protein
MEVLEKNKLFVGIKARCAILSHITKWAILVYMYVMHFKFNVLWNCSICVIVHVLKADQT